MAQAIRLAEKGIYTTRTNPRVGCVIVKDDEVLGQGFHAYPGQPHAEINAIQDAQGTDLTGSTVYVTLEPCAHTGKTPPCVNAILNVKPKKVVIAMQDPNPLVSGKSIEQLKQHGIEIIVGVLEQQAFALNPGFIKRMSSQLPYVRLKMAMSLDGKTALKNGLSEWISGKQSRQDVQYLRARSCAIISGINTVLADDPSLNVRLTMQELGLDQEIQQPIRVVLDSKLQMPLNAKMLHIPGETWVFSCHKDVRKIALLEAKNCRVFIQGRRDSLDLQQVMEALAKEGINEVHTECGSRLAGSLLNKQLVDEVIIYIAPKLLGAQAMGLVDFGELTQMDQALNINVKNVTQIGADIKLQCQPLY